LCFNRVLRTKTRESHYHATTSVQQPWQQATPIVVDGRLYLSTAWSKGKAFDVLTGAETGFIVQPGPLDGHNWYPMALSLDTGLSTFR